jgi:RNA polymerase sigma-70 factor (ECF subfamily)
MTLTMAMPTPSADTMQREALERTILRELPVLYRVAQRLTRDSARAEDLVAQSLLAATRAWGQFDGRFPRSWLLRILKNEHFRQSGKELRRGETPLDDAGEAGDDGFWEQINHRLLAEDLLRALESIPEDFRLVVTLCDVEGLSYEEAALAMEIPIGTVRSRLFRGRKLLRSRVVHWAEEKN